MMRAKIMIIMKEIRKVGAKFFSNRGWIRYGTRVSVNIPDNISILALINRVIKEFEIIIRFGKPM